MEAFGAGTAVIVASIGKIGFGYGSGRGKDMDMVLPEYEGGLGPIAKAFRKRILDVQEGRESFKGWGVRLDEL